MNNEQSPKLAVLIDADNASADIIDALLEEIAKYGIASVKRIYGDWSSGLKKWKGALLPHAITPVQQFAYTKGKNATDMALVIDAMDLLYSNTFDGFCIVSSDSDFTRLASRLRENGRTVYGFGEKKTPEAFRKACDKFVYTEIFQPARKAPAPADSPNRRGRPAKNAAEPATNTNDSADSTVGKIDANLLNLLYRAVKESADDLGWAGLGAVGSYVNKVTPDFDARNYGFSKFSSLIKSLPQFATQVDNNQLKVRRTQAAKAASGSLKAETANTVAHTAPAAVAENNNSTPKRGRPAKNAAAADENAPEAPRRRGRPAKQADAAETSVKQTRTAAKSKQNSAAKAKPGKAKSSSSASGHNFGRLIPLVQQAVDAAANPEGWARLGDVVKQLPQLDAAFAPQNHGFDDARDAIRAIYADWLEINKIGRGERVRINKRFVVREERADSRTEVAAAPISNDAATDTPIPEQTP